MSDSVKVIISRVSFFLVVLGCGYGAFHYFKKEKKPEQLSASGAVVEDNLSLQQGNRYRIFIKSLIVPPVDTEGKKWDGNGKGSAPDVFFRIFYKDHMIYESSTMNDVLVAEYAAIKGGVTDAIFSKNASDYLEAANVAFQEKGAHFKIEVIDSDTFDNDLIGKTTVELKDLQLGSNILEKLGITYVIVVIDSDSDINESLKALKMIK